MNISKTLFASIALSVSMTTFAQTELNIKARNVVAISENLVTAGQPTAESLAGLSKLGFKAVINLAPPTAPDAVANEAQIVSDQGMSFVNIPVQWTNPTEADFLSFVEAMKRFQGQKVLVHCQANMRASAMTFLYRVIVAKENPALAYETVLKVWAPKDQWKELINSQLQKANIAFEIK
ncbi:protein tyrosine phosphatase family protein [Undibacterium sp. LX40W]|uniref:Protein tyrosine phosphatase family protein n=1 Tax=Undibacterium nitidum TaxID=2762298 RepID=A0A923HMS7_9BURK|nr:MULTISPECIES: protein tyrosine phosphatase family protein [Undibacterium]MBC3880671.1 protein tyrosine phosphatase family protein [Undibacterium nitidum]MBC3890593.1 protein tyrosine phosphatase family protein [Undibacterium sp. LX40W]